MIIIINNETKRNRCNVDMLKMIQLGLSFANEKGELPESGCCTWQFNFAFNLRCVAELGHGRHRVFACSKRREEKRRYRSGAARRGGGRGRNKRGGARGEMLARAGGGTGREEAHSFSSQTISHQPKLEHFS